MILIKLIKLSFIGGSRVELGKTVATQQLIIQVDDERQLATGSSLGNVIVFLEGYRVSGTVVPLI